MRRKSPKRLKRAGTILVLSAALMVIMFGMIAFAVDIGYISVVSTELQRSADAAASAAANMLLEKTVDPEYDVEGWSYAELYAKWTAAEYAYTAGNQAGGKTSVLSWDDAVVGYPGRSFRPNLRDGLQ